jgi:DNA polymerase I-like protein with 3'-5' exonuclease and polymerase domains
MATQVAWSDDEVDAPKAIRKVGGLLPPEGLPLKYHGNYIDIAGLTDEQRRMVGLSWSGSITEVVGSKDNRFGLDAALAAVKYARDRGIGTLDLETDGDEAYYDPEDEDSTAGLDPYKSKIILCQIGDEKKQWLFWWQTLSAEAKDVIRQWWSDQESRKAGVNLKFDARMLLAQEGLHWRGARILDAQLLEMILGCGLLGGDVGLTMKLTGMAAMAKRWLGWQLPKDEDVRTGWGKLTPGKWHATPDEYAQAVSNGTETRTYEQVKWDGLRKRYYAADDCVVPVRLVEIQAQWLQHLDLLETVKLEMDFLPVLAEMEVRGLNLDKEKWEQLSKEADVAYAKAELELDALFEVTVTYAVDLDGKVEVTRDKNYGSKDELKDLIYTWMKREYSIDVIGNNRQFKAACLAGGMNPMRAEVVFEKKLIPNKENPEKDKQVGFPNMTDYIEGSEYVESVWDAHVKFLPPGSFALPTTDSKFLKLLRILNETPDDYIDDIPEIPTKIGLPPKLVTPILAYREASTKLQRYAWSWFKLVNDVSGRIHTDTTQAAADTGRLTTRPNFQNLPTDDRYRAAACHAQPGYKIVGADFSQIEPRIIAQISQCATYMRIFWSEMPGTPGFDYWCGPDVTEPLDLYGGVGVSLGVMPPEGEKKSVAKDKGNKEVQKGRKKSKIAVLGLGYGTGKSKFHISYILDTGEYHPRDESNDLFDGFWATASEVKDALDALSDIAYPGPDEFKGTRQVKWKSPRAVWHPIAEARVTWSESLGSRKRYFDHRAPQWWTQGRNHPIQATGADILKRTCVELGRWMWEKNIDGFLILTAHDELLAEVREDQAELVRAKMEEYMATVGQGYCPHVPITAGAYVADVWEKD